MTNMPIENAAQQAASAPQPIVGADGHVVLPTTEQLLQTANAQIQAEQANSTPPTKADAPQATYTPTPVTLDPRVLTKSMSAFVKAQTHFIHSKEEGSLETFVSAMENHADVLAQFAHDRHLPSYAGAMEAHIAELTAVLEQQGVL